LVAGEIVDAKQRAIITTRRYDKELDKWISATCAEPSPDVFSVLGSSLAASAKVTDGDREAMSNISRSLSEAGANIGLRTQTIQILRDVMYRSCEDYMNGFMTRAEFSIRAARDQRLIVSILAIEQLTGTVRNSPAAITVSGNADAGKGLIEATKNLDAKKAEHKSSKSAVEKAQKKLDTENEKLKKAKDKVAESKGREETIRTEIKNVSAELELENNAEKKDEAKIKELKAKLNKLKGSLTAEEGKTKNLVAEVDKIEKSKELKEAKEGLKSAKEKEKSTSEEVAKLEEIRKAHLNASTSTVAKFQISGCDNCDRHLPEKSVEKISDTIERIVQNTFDTDEVTLMCIRVMNIWTDRALNVSGKTDGSSPYLDGMSGIMKTCRDHFSLINTKDKVEQIERTKAAVGDKAAIQLFEEYDLWNN